VGKRRISVRLCQAVAQWLYLDSLQVHPVGDRGIGVKATLPRRRKLPPLGNRASLHGGVQRIANSELLTAGNPTV